MVGKREDAMSYQNKGAKINIRLLAILLLVTVAIGMSLYAARQIGRSILSKASLTAGEAAFAREDWRAAARDFREYLGRNSDDVAILEKYAKAVLSVRPLEAPGITGAISAYRRVIQLDPRHDAACEALARLYIGTENFEELACVARTRLEHDPGDRAAPLWLAEALARLNKTQEARDTLSEFIEGLEAIPDRCAEYVQACVQMSRIASQDRSPEAQTTALGWLNKAVSYAPDSVEAIAHRARFYRQTRDIPGLSEERRLSLACRDLEAADALGTDNPRIRLFLGAEWMACGALDRAAAQLRAIESLPRERLKEHFFDVDDWAVARFLFAAELAMRRGAATEGVSLADAVLKTLQERRHRVQALPSAVQLYVAGGKVPQARRCLDEYLDIQYTLEGQAQSKWRPAYLRALVARAEDKPYAVIDALQPFAMTDASRPELWRLLAEAYSRTDQARWAVGALGSNPNHPALLLARGKSELALGNPQAAVELARLDLASSLYQAGNADRAEVLYREMLDQHPNDARALNDLAWILQERHCRYGDALELANKGLNLAPGNVYLLDTRGTILSNMPDRLADAKSDFERIVELSSSDVGRQARTLLQLGRVCVKLNDFAAARQHLSDALELDRKANVLTEDERSEITNIVQHGGT